MKMIASLLATGLLLIAAPAYAQEQDDEPAESSEDGAEIDSARGPRSSEAEIDSAEPEDQGDQGQAEEPEA